MLQQTTNCCCFSGKWAYAKAALTATITLVAIGLIGYYAKTDSASFQQGFLGAFGSAAGLSFILFVRELIRHCCPAPVPPAPRPPRPPGPAVPPDQHGAFQAEHTRLVGQETVIAQQLVAARLQLQTMQGNGTDQTSVPYLHAESEVTRLGTELASIKEQLIVMRTREGADEVIHPGLAPGARARLALQDAVRTRFVGETG